MKKIVLSLLCISISLFSAGQAPANDECGGALAVTPSPDTNPGTSVVCNNTGATQSMTACFGMVQNDVWFTFTATSTRHRINISTNNNISPVVQVFGGTCGSLQSLGCFTVGTDGVYNLVNVNLANLTPGATYYYRTYSPFNNIGTDISTYITTLPTDAANNECSGALELSINADNSCSDVYSGNLEFATQSRPSCVSSVQEAKDLWFKFVATSAFHRITVNSISYDNYVFEVFSGTCSSLASIACVNTGSTFEPDIAVLSNLVAGNTYYIRLYDYSGGSSANQRFSICINTGNNILDNDNCSGALAITPSPGFYPGPSVSSYNIGATQSMPGCIGTADDDMWFKFTATATRHRVEVSVNTNVIPVLEVFSGTCTSLQSIVCRSANSSYSYVNADLTNLTPGATYYYRTYGSSSNERVTKFTTYILTPTTDVVNDECSGALAVTPSPDANPSTSVISNNAGATPSMTGCYGTAQNDIWFKFTATSSKHRINITTNRGINPAVQVFGGTCGSLQPLGCWGVSTSGGGFDVVNADLAGLTPGATYYYRVYGSSSGGTNITTYVITLPTAAVNDECSSAVTLFVNTGSSCTNVYSGFLDFATQSRASCVPGGNIARDIWFKFVATSSSHRITVAPVGFSNYMFEVFSGTCNNLTSLACVNTGALSEPDITVTNNLIAGNTYYVRIYDFNYNNGNNVNEQFTICISTTDGILDNDNCNGALTVIPSTQANSSPDVVSHNFGATQSMAGCFGTAEDDIWFKFTATSTRHLVYIFTTQKINPVLEVFSGTCGSMQSISCRYVNTSESYYFVNADLTNLTPGATYYYRTYGSGNNVRTSITTYISTLPAVILPITMTSFTVKSEIRKNVLKWQTQWETNNSGFEIQYSKDGIRFDSLHFVASNGSSGNSSVTQTYMYEHDLTNVATGKIYYRLKQTDYDLHDNYSNIITAEILSTQNISILPNPVDQHIYVRMPQTKGYKFVVCDFEGKIFKQGVLQNNEIRVPELKSGMYILRLTNDKGAVVILKFIKL